MNTPRANKRCPLPTKQKQHVRGSDVRCLTRCCGNKGRTNMRREHARLSWTPFMYQQDKLSLVNNITLQVYQDKVNFEVKLKTFRMTLVLFCPQSSWGFTMQMTEVKWTGRGTEGRCRTLKSPYKSDASLTFRKAKGVKKHPFKLILKSDVQLLTILPSRFSFSQKQYFSPQFYMKQFELLQL